MLNLALSLDPLGFIMFKLYLIDSEDLGYELKDRFDMVDTAERWAGRVADKFGCRVEVHHVESGLVREVSPKT